MFERGERDGVGVPGLSEGPPVVAEGPLAGVVCWSELPVGPAAMAAMLAADVMAADVMAPDEVGPAGAGVDEVVVGRTLEELLIGWEAQARWVAAQRARVLARYTRGVTRAGEVALLLTTSEPVAEQLIETARMLTGWLPGTLAALQAGRIPERNAVVLAQELGALDAQLAGRLEGPLLAKAQTETPGRLRRQVRTVVALADPGRAATEAERARARRGVRCRQLGDGLAEIQAWLGIEDAARVMTALTAAADADRGGPEDCRSLTARRADALVDALVSWADQTHAAGPAPTTGPADVPVPAGQEPTGAEPAGGGGDSGGGRSGGGGRPRLRDTVGIVIDLDTLLGLQDTPGYLPGHGTLPAPLARHLAADADWRRLVTDPVTGFLLDYGTTTYRPPADLARFLVARDQHCRFPHCPQPAWRCDLDHRTPFADDGATASHNMLALCRHHHQLKHQGGWTLTGDPTTAVTWTSATGHTYTTTPTSYDPTLLTDFETPPPDDITTRVTQQLTQQIDDEYDEDTGWWKNTLHPPPPPAPPAPPAPPPLPPEYQGDPPF